VTIRIVVPASGLIRGKSSCMIPTLVSGVEVARRLVADEERRGG